MVRAGQLLDSGTENLVVNLSHVAATDLSFLAADVEFELAGGIKGKSNAGGAGNGRVAIHGAFQFAESAGDGTYGTSGVRLCCNCVGVLNLLAEGLKSVSKFAGVEGAGHSSESMLRARDPRTRLFTTRSQWHPEGEVPLTRVTRRTLGRASKSVQRKTRRLTGGVCNEKRAGDEGNYFCSKKRTRMFKGVTGNRVAKIEVRSGGSS